MVVNPKNLADAYQLYIDQLDPNEQGTKNLLKTALIRHTLSGYGLADQASRSDAFQFMSSIRLTQIKDILEVQDQVFLRRGESVKPQTKRTYRSVLKKFLDWCKKQKWWRSKHLVEQQPKAEKRAPRMKLSGVYAHKTRVTGKSKPSRYRLEEFTDNLQQELDEFQRFMSALTWEKREGGPLKPSTVEKRMEDILLVLGWLRRFKQVPLEELSLSALVGGRQSLPLIHECLLWLKNERACTAASEINFLNALINAAKFLHHKKSKMRFYRDIPLIEQLRKLIAGANKQYEQSPHVVDQNLKWLSWDELLDAVEQLKEECCERWECAVKRPLSAVAKSYQRYLIIALHVYIPPGRQQLFRGLQVGKNLFFENGKWIIKQQAEGYKTGKTYGYFEIEIPDILYPELEAWLTKWRAELSPTHEFVFTQVTGNPHDKESLKNLFVTAICRITGKMTNPHLVRSIFITHCIDSGVDEVTMRALARSMNHSYETQQIIYNRQHPQRKVQPALDLVKQMSIRQKKPSV